ncbi:MAG: biotin-dependent carboxyltransferase family protein [Aureliella sp.]
MKNIEVIQAGLLTTLQDGGRAGLAFFAIPASGPLDRVAAQTANVLAGNAPMATLIECNFTPPSLRFDHDATLSLTGADMHWQIDQNPVARYRTLNISAGSVLSGKPAVQGSRGYIAVAGEIETTRSFGSTACYALAELGGNDGRALRVGDLIATHPLPVSCRVELSLPVGPSTPVVVDLLPGPEYDDLFPESQALLEASHFQIAADSNRMGARIHGPQLASREGLLDSLPVLPGMVQLLPSGNCIVVLQDGQTTGGYPRIAYLPSRSLDRFNQIRINQPFFFSNLNS